MIRIHYLALTLVALCMGCTADPETQPNPTDARGPDVSAPQGIDGGTTLSPDQFDFDAGMTDIPDGSADVVLVPSVEPRTCIHRFEYQGDPGTTSVTVPASFNGWDQDALPMEAVENNRFVANLDLSVIEPGSYGYKFLVNGTDWILDQSNMMRRFDDGTQNSKLRVPNCEQPIFELVSRKVNSENGEAAIEVQLRPGVGGAVEWNTVTVTHNFTPYPVSVDENGIFRIDEMGLSTGKHTWRFDATYQGNPIEPLQVSFWVEKQTFTWSDAILYFAFVDRFEDASPGPPAASCEGLSELSNWVGGDWKGIQARIEAGYFDELGVNTLWINAAMDNPEDCVSGLGGQIYTAYHGYFPEDLFAPEPRYGSMQDLRDMVSAAHARGIRVVMDLVANHVFETAPEWLEHQDNGWFNTPIYLCGWEQAETCWFQSYMPDLNHRNDDVVEYITDVALHWIREANLDGFRVDAVKHMHPHFLYTLRSRIENVVEPGSGQTFWLVGETFTGAWGGGNGSEENLIKKYIGPDQLHGQFDFPLYWTLLETLGRHEAGLDKLADVLNGSMGFYGDDALMSSFLGNHDVPRFVSHAAGDIGDLWGNGAHAQAWSAPPDQPASTQPYERLKQAFTLLAGLNQIPLLYYGDEIGLAGAGDPDNRRVMMFDGLSAIQEELLAHVKQVFQARKGSEALRRGDFNFIHTSTDSLAFHRQEGQSEAIVVINRGSSPVTLDLSGVGEATFIKLDGSTHNVANPFELPASSSDILLKKP